MLQRYHTRAPYTPVIHNMFIKTMNLNKTRKDADA